MWRQKRASVLLFPDTHPSDSAPNPGGVCRHEAWPCARSSAVCVIVVVGDM